MAYIKGKANTIGGVEMELLLWYYYFMKPNSHT